MQLYNTLTKKQEIFEPQNPPQVTLYTCGPTVYDFQHIGNYSAYVRWDTLARALGENGYSVNWVMNITDVGHLVNDADEGEDKLEKGAKREGKTAWDIAKLYSSDFLHTLQALNIHPSRIVYATEHIAEQIALVKTLETRGYTYKINDGIYFNTAKFPRYGTLTGQDLQQLKEGARVEANPLKINPTDFALWKFSPQGKHRDMEWDSPWGKGFPGWHIECSAMAMKYLGETLDIHAGGKEHIAVHHTNEIAQSEAATGKPFARFWMHGNHLMVDGVKISKSLSNGITPAELAKQGFSPLDLRLLLLQSHYRSEANFTLGGLQAARSRRLSLQAFADLRFQILDGGEVASLGFAEVQSIMCNELSNDLRTPEALAALSDLASTTEESLVAPEARDAFIEFLNFLDRTLGLELLASTPITADQKSLIKKRDAARVQKDFVAADTLRDQLAEQGIALRDTPVGTIWSRTS
ncbi:MAG TPA: cysteine--tRNA ligase [Candidatus Saccharimonadales bacterium]|nr:cysteine--tRNA ligase [Candidatus Saccharimonadales bacterium]